MNRKASAPRHEFNPSPNEVDSLRGDNSLFLLFVIKEFPPFSLRGAHAR